MANVNITCLTKRKAQILVIEASANMLMPRLVVHSYNCPQHA